MLGYIIAIVGIVAIVFIIMAIRGAGAGGTPRSTGEPRPDEKKGTSYQEPQAEQLRTAEQQAHKSE